jgi:hypothetical protein
MAASSNDDDRLRDEVARALRAGDADRQRVAERLHSAVSEGRLTFNEYDDRLRDAYGAQTYGDLDAILNDLPAPGAVEVAGTLPPMPSAPSPEDMLRPPMALVILWMIWAGLAAISVVALVLTSIASGRLVVWPLWVSGPTGAALLTTTVGVQWIRRTRRRP